MIDPQEYISLKDDEKKSEKLLKRAFRFPKHTLLEQQVCQRILQATFSIVNSVIIDNTTIAVLMMEKESNKQNFQELDFELFKKFSKINSSLKSAFLFHNYNHNLVHSIPWSFSPTKENFEAYIEPWYQTGVEFFPNHIKHNLTLGKKISHNYNDIIHKCNLPLSIFNPTIENLDTHIKFRIPEYCPKCEYRIIRSQLSYEKCTVVNFDAPKGALFFEATGCLTTMGYERIKTSFETYAKGFCLDAINVLSNFVSPKTYDEMKKRIFKDQPEGERN